MATNVELDEALLSRAMTLSGSSTDFLICACALHWDIPILSKDRAFQAFSQHLPLRLHQPRTKT